MLSNFKYRQSASTPAGDFVRFHRSGSGCQGSAPMTPGLVDSINKRQGVAFIALRSKGKPRAGIRETWVPLPHREPDQPKMRHGKGANPLFRGCTLWFRTGSNTFTPCLNNGRTTGGKKTTSAKCGLPSRPQTTPGVDRQHSLIHNTASGKNPRLYDGCSSSKSGAYFAPDIITGGGRGGCRRQENNAARPYHYALQKPSKCISSIIRIAGRLKIYLRGGSPVSTLIKTTLLTFLNGGLTDGLTPTSARR